MLLFDCCKATKSELKVALTGRENGRTHSADDKLALVGRAIWARDQMKRAYDDETKERVQKHERLTHWESIERVSR